MSKLAAQQAMRAGRLHEARDHLLRLLDGPDDGPELRYNLAMVLVRLSEFAAAIPHLSRCLRAAPGNPDILCNLGNCQRLAGHLSEARKSLDAALTAAPSHPGALANRGWLLLAMGEAEAAAVDFRELGRISPDAPEAHRGLAEALAAGGRLDEAIEALQLASERLGDEPRLLAALGALYARRRDTEQAYTCLDRALALAPDNAEAHLNRGICAEQLGDLEQAEADFRAAIRLQPDLAAAHFQLAHLPARSATVADLNAIERALEHHRAPQARIDLAFALGKAHASRGEHAAAFAAFTRARQQLHAQAPFPIDSALARIAAIQRQPVAPAAAEPVAIIFVIGMPRSGTTLVDQILASHPRTRSVGESGAVGRALALYSEALGARYPDSSHRLDDSLRRAMARSLREDLAGAVPVTVDTSPGNLLYAGLLGELLPEARFIYCQRDARDTCVSIYEQPLTGAHGYANRLEDLGRYYAASFSLARHWQQLLGERLVTVDYEALCSEPEEQIRRLLEASALPFAEQCLRPEQHRRAVITPSAGQVRQPISPRSIGRWRHYGDALAPLLAELPPASYTAP